MNTATIKFDTFENLKNQDCQDRIIQAKKTLGNEVVILGHHYQNEEVYRHADYAGDYDHDGDDGDDENDVDDFDDDGDDDDGDGDDDDDGQALRKKCL